MTERRRKLRVGVIFGGRSGEHEVSLMSARSVMSAISPEHYEIVPIGITKAGAWIVGGDPMKALSSGANQADTAPAALLADPARQAILELSRPQGAGGESILRSTPIDVAFPVLHGPLGEDGTVQGLLELANIPYVGAGVLASAVAMDKAVAKDIFAARGFPIVPHVLVKRKLWEQNPAAVIADVEARIAYPCFVKPACLGSSVGISKVHQRGELGPALDLAAQYDRKILVEKAVEPAREIEVSVLGNDEPAASVAGEIIPCREFYDYRAKYIEERSELIIPAPLPPALSAQIRRIAVEAFLAIDAAGMARVDFLLERGTDRFYLNEINTIPGFTSISMYPKLWEASGIPYSELIDRLIDLALERHADKNRSRTSYVV
jgi:D-alanine-D-alanine ligase